MDPESWVGRGVGWVVVGCESGPGRRHTRIEWIRDVVRQCQEAGVPVFVKQIEVPRLSRERLEILHDDNWHPRVCSAIWEDSIEDHGSRVSHSPAEWPADLRVRQLPEAWLEGARG